MKYHMITIIILLVAIAFYLAGYSGAGNIGFFAGAAFETWFWIRILFKRPSSRKDSSSTIS